MPLDLQKYDLMVVSDLHLSEGRDPLIKKFSLNEDFFFDEEFGRMLDYQMHRLAGRPRERKWHLIINGDFLDFLQVVSIKIDPERDVRVSECDVREWNGQVDAAGG